MFKGERETKGRSATEEKIPDVITHDGRTYHRRDFEDEARPGYSRVGRLYSSFELQLCGRWGLISPSGHLFAAHLPIALAADPTRVSASEGPEGLRRAVAEAEQRLAEAAAKVSTALNARDAAEAEQLRAARRQDKLAYNVAVANAAVAEERRKDLELAIPPCRVALSHANERLKFWMDDEALRRQGHVDEPAQSVF